MEDMLIHVGVLKKKNLTEHLLYASDISKGCGYRVNKTGMTSALWELTFYQEE